MMARFKLGDLFTLSIIAILGAAVYVASDWVLRASIIVLVLGGVGLAFAIVQLILDVLSRRPSQAAKPKRRPEYELPTFEEADPRATLMGALEIWGWLVGLFVAILILGLPAALPLFVLAYAKYYGASWWMSLLLTALIGAFIYGIYQQIMHVYWPDSLLGTFLGTG